MLTHPGAFGDYSQNSDSGNLSLMTELRNHLGRWVYPVHRLDRAASGVVIMGLSSSVAAIMAAAFRAHQVRKTYLALVRGWLSGSGQIERPLSRLDRSGDQSALSLYSSLGQWSAHWPVRPFPTSRYTLVELNPITGRTHQLRRHLAGISHPIVGDTKYGDGAHNQALRQQCGCHRLLLHASRLQIKHPLEDTVIDVEAIPPLLLSIPGLDTVMKKEPLLNV